MSGKGGFWSLPGSSLSPDLSRKKKGLHEHRTGGRRKTARLPCVFFLFLDPLCQPAGLPVKKIMLDSMPASMLS